jgi:putative hemolysin
LLTAAATTPPTGRFDRQVTAAFTAPADHTKLRRAPRTLRRNAPQIITERGSLCDVRCEENCLELDWMSICGGNGAQHAVRLESHARARRIAPVDLLWNLLQLATIPALVALNGLFVAAEFAMVAVRRTRLEELVAHSIKGARSAQKAVENLNRTIAATQLGVTLSSLGLGWVAESALARMFLELFAQLPAPWSWIARHSVAGTIAFLLITFLHIVFGELVPKTLALQAPDRWALWLAGPLGAFTLITRPLIVLINRTGNAVVRLCGFREAPESSVHSVEELSLLIEDTEEAGVIDPDQAELVQNIFALSDKFVRDCMVPRAKMAALALNTPLPKALDIVRAGGHTRLPVYEGDPNNIVGIVNSKDLFFLIEQEKVFVLEDAIYPALFLRPDEEIGNALRLFRKAKRHMAVVRDEAGAVLGLITLEDVLEEIIGDIEDEQDRPHPKRGFLKTRRKVRRPADQETARQGDRETRRPADKEIGRQGDKEMGKQ